MEQCNLFNIGDIMIKKCFSKKTLITILLLTAAIQLTAEEITLTTTEDIHVSRESYKEKTKSEIKIVKELVKTDSKTLFIQNDVTGESG